LLAVLTVALVAAFLAGAALLGTLLAGEVRFAALAVFVAFVGFGADFFAAAALVSAVVVRAVVAGFLVVPRRATGAAFVARAAGAVLLAISAAPFEVLIRRRTGPVPEG
jgi:hypothetical protein